MSIEKIHEQTGKILEAKSRVEVLNIRLSELRKSKKVIAKLSLEINGNRRSAFMEWLTFSEVERILYERLMQAEEVLSKLQSEFKG